MLQTDRRAETTRQTPQERDLTQRRQTHETRNKAAQALEAILSGGSWEQLSADGVLALSHTLGNAALLEVMALRDTGPELAASSLPGTALSSEPMGGFGGQPLLSEAPAFGALSPIGSLAPVEA